MQSLYPDPSNPWPHDMLLRIEDQNAHLTELLFVRAAWGLAPDIPVPELDPRVMPGESRMPDTATREEWDRRWRQQWAKTWLWYDYEEPWTPEAGLQSIAEKSEAMNPYFPPRWTDDYGWDGIDREALDDWVGSMPDPHQLRLEDEPERRNLDDLIPAWKSGLDTIVVVPFAGYFAKRITTRHLVVSSMTRNDPASYALALGVPMTSID
ncbi:hypothetical protein [Glaciihabitans sp. dw_435]|uniref:hypothetical protein n=1 Tax=Glaciihabitans sp. dw_435 TaxID=2720081 RepID=UPI001BD47C39|nr:hypothetical protein [Glaciihabitans sp. dw_435]